MMLTYLLTYMCLTEIHGEQGTPKSVESAACEVEGEYCHHTHVPRPDSGTYEVLGGDEKIEP